MSFKKVLFLLPFLAITALSSAQNKVSALLVDKSNGDPVGFATVSITREGQVKPAKYVLSNEGGKVLIEGVRNGKYSLKVELLGYKALTKDISVASANVDLGELAMEADTEQIDAATVSAVGNPIVIKKDTIEYNASSFKTTDNDVLEDLLKKLPGVEVSEDGSITVNGETVKKITIDGKTFFLDDPQLASKNIPAKIINKLKVVEKKSEQAEFTGIEDGEEETVIDLSVKKGMMKGVFGNVTAGVGHDVPGNSTVKGDTRFQGAGFLGSFREKSQISVILNANNTNNRGFNDLSGGMMGGMMGGGGGMGRGQGGWGNGNGVTTSYMGGVNGAWDLFQDKMSLGGNYLYNYTSKDVQESSNKSTYLDDYTLNYNSDGRSLTNSGGHRFGIRLDHKFSDNTSILFEPRVNFGNGNYLQTSNTSTYRNNEESPLNMAEINNTGNNRNVTTNGFLLLRQKLGIPGRTLTVMGRYEFSNNVLDGKNWNKTIDADNEELVDQFFNNNQKNASAMGRVTYTEPLGNHFYVEANYAYNWSKSTSDKKTYDTQTKELVEAYSNNIINENTRQDIGANMMYQTDKVRAQLGFSAMPTRTTNITSSRPEPYRDFRWNFSPQAMLWGEFSENFNARMFYRGNSSQPSVNQLLPVPDNTDPLNIRFGNPSLTPYFSHNLNGDIRYNNKQNFLSFNVRFGGGLVQNPIVSAMWYGSNGAQYTMPFNGPNSGSARINLFLNAPIAKSGFTISNTLNSNWSVSSSYIGNNVDMSKYPDPTVDYYSFMQMFTNDHPDMASASDFYLNTTNNFGLTERLRFIYRNDALELTLGGRTRLNKSWYTSKAADNMTTFNNQVSASVNWTWDEAGLTVKSDYDFNWYNGYKTQQPNENILNAEIQKMLFKNKVTLALKGYDILGQAKNLTVSDESNYHQETVNNTLGRYIILAVTFRFGQMSRNSMRGPGGPGGHGPGGPGPGGPGPGGPRP
ncbi:MAG: outer membrane beta-barrel protein [Bacteroidales bacterium]|nr:outer membrane beta-barrel protein [Bacteroidales bacterium]